MKDGSLDDTLTLTSGKLSLNIDHRLVFSSFALSSGLSRLLIEFQSKAVSLVSMAILRWSLVSWKLAYFRGGLAGIEGSTVTAK